VCRTQTGKLQLLDTFPAWGVDSKPADVAVYAKAIFYFNSSNFATKNAFNDEALSL
jgi:hypothetical protein